MSIKELKRLNVISTFENLIDEHMRKDDYELTLNCPDGKISFTFQVTESLFQSEKDYITSHLNRRKGYQTQFVELEELLKPKSGFKYSSTLKEAHKVIVDQGLHLKGTQYFLVFKNRF